MKVANVIIPAKEFLFDTWYGPNASLQNASVR